MTKDRGEYVIGYRTSAKPTSGNYRASRVTVTLGLEEKPDGLELSVSGAVWDARGSDIDTGGQCLDTLAGEVECWARLNSNAPRYMTPHRFQRLREVWKRWHLNGMNAACTHQRDSGAFDPMAPVEVVVYKLTTEALKEQGIIRDHVTERLKADGRVELSDEARAVYALRYTVHEAPDADSYASGRYEVAERKTVRASELWYPGTSGSTVLREDPRGILCKPCPTCGHPWGSAWLFEPLPDDVVTFVRRLMADLPKLGCD